MNLRRSFFSLSLGIFLVGCVAPHPQPQIATTQQMPPAEVRPSAPVRSLRNPDSPNLPASPAPGPKLSYSSVHVNGPYIAITFDDGPHPVNTPKLLALLRERNIKATWFVVGEMARAHPELIRQILADGHEIGNHTMTHPLNITRLSDERIRQEVGETAAILENAAGYHSQLFRPPGGSTNPHIKQMLHDEFGYTTILWSVDPNDWKRPGVSVVAHRLINGARPGAILLCHDIHAPTIAAMPETLDTLLAKGYHFVTVSQLISMDSPVAAASAGPPGS